MDRSLYVAMTGAMQTLNAQAANSHNLANASTVGFRAELVNTQAAPIPGAGLQSRVNAVAQSEGWDSTPGTIMTTGRDLDIALRGDNWLAVQASDGSEAYTRAGDLRLTPEGQLTTGAGHPVLADSGVLAVPPNTGITIGNDGTISVIGQGQGPATLAQVGRLKVMTIAPGNLERGLDGLMRVKPGAEAQPAAGVSITTGALEASNVNPAEAMVNMIQLARQLELQTKLMKTADDNGAASSSILRAV
ncbi:MAG TPA: flagellar basal body rod protein FlgF [Nevskiaceae bacterium]|nr:flagellar basal body rod protein FlgF [Nevskiaceae bacterium]